MINLKIKTEIHTSIDKIMYNKPNFFEIALTKFGKRVEIIVALEMGDKINSEEAYKRIKEELKTLKKLRKTYKKHLDPKDKSYFDYDRNKTYDQMVSEGYEMTADGFWIRSE